MTVQPAQYHPLLFAVRCSGAHPRLMRNYGTGDDDLGGTTAMQRAKQRLYHAHGGEVSVSKLLLPVHGGAGELRFSSRKAVRFSGRKALA